VLDCSAGTGILATEIFERFDVGRLHLNDPAADMLNVAKQKLTGISQGITYSNFYAEELHQMLPDQFDHLICLNSFHYYVDQARMISNAYKLLSPGGTLWLLDWNRKGFFIINSRLIDWFSSMNIQTRTLEETECMLKEHGFTTSGQEEWRFRLWNFFSLRATKRS
jgi:ubiquinone/menaquinone biosynthesis C-methylase UbiE